MRNSVVNPFLQFNLPNVDKAAGLCKLYLGVKDATNPEANQVQAYAVLPDGSELPIAQPITLSAGGVAMFNGSPVQLKVDVNDVSIKLTTMHGAQVYYAARYSFTVSASQVQMPWGATLDQLSLSATFATVAQMQASVTAQYVGQRVQWLGYHAPSDGGSGWGIVKSGSYTPDGGKIIAVGLNLYVEQNINGFSLSVKKYGVRGDGSTPDTVQMQRCFNSGNKNIRVPRGVYILGALTVPDWLTVTGVGHQSGVGGGDRITEFRFSITDSSNAITCGYNPVFKNIIFINAGGTYNETNKTLSGTMAGCIKLLDNAVIEDCSFLLWRDVIRTGLSTFYLKTSRVVFNRCTNGYVSEGTSPYNMHIDAPESTLTENFIVGVGLFTPRSIKIIGGSIEGYSTVATRFLDLSIFGTYFESEPERTVFNAIEPQLDGSMVSLFGCTIFMNRTTRFVNMSGLNNVSLTGSGNTFTGSVSSLAACYYLPESGSVSLGGDKIEESITANTVYVDSISKAIELGGIKMPLLHSTNPQAVYSSLTLVGKAGLIAGAYDAEPTMKSSGQMFLANGSTWDPLSRATGRPYYVIWQGDVWSSVSGN